MSIIRLTKLGKRMWYTLLTLTRRNVTRWYTIIPPG